MVWRGCSKRHCITVIFDESVVAVLLYYYYCVRIAVIMPAMPIIFTPPLFTR